jgi:hypothetical protein
MLRQIVVVLSFAAGAALLGTQANACGCCGCGYGYGSAFYRPAVPGYYFYAPGYYSGYLGGPYRPRFWWNSRFYRSWHRR